MPGKYINKIKYINKLCITTVSANVTKHLPIYAVAIKDTDETKDETQERTLFSDQNE